MVCGVWVCDVGLGRSRVLIVGSPGFLICRLVGLPVLSV